MKSLAISLAIHLLLAALVFGMLYRTPAQVRVESIEVISSDPSSSEASGPKLTALPQPLSPAKTADASPKTSTGTGSSTSVGAKVGSDSAARSSALNAYLSGVRDKLSSALKPPRTRSPLRVLLKLTLLETGDVIESSIEQPSGSAEFDRAVLDALNRSRPFPHFSSEMASLHRITLKLPIEILPRR